jgi:DNA-binding NarL/FixJ family response regulator
MSSVDGLDVLIADDHPVVRSGLAALVGTIPGATVVGEAADGEQVVRLAADLQPDVVVMDLHMPVVDGVVATRRIVAASPHVNVVVLTMLDDDDSVFAAMRAGARGYLVKGAAGEDVVRAIEAVGRGDAIFSPAIADRLIRFFDPTPPAPLFPELTDREREVLELIALGDPNPVIARKLGVRPKTVRNHVSNVFTKLQVADRAAAILRARDVGLAPR